MDSHEGITPKLVRMAEEAVAGMQADGLMEAREIMAWDSWRNGPQPLAGADGKVPVPRPLADLFRRALSREAAGLRASIDAGHDADGDMGNDLALIRTLLPS